MKKEGLDVRKVVVVLSIVLAFLPGAFAEFVNVTIVDNPDDIFSASCPCDVATDPTCQTTLDEMGITSCSTTAPGIPQGGRTNNHCGLSGPNPPAAQLLEFEVNGPVRQGVMSVVGGERVYCRLNGNDVVNIPNHDSGQLITLSTNNRCDQRNTLIIDGSSFQLGTNILECGMWGAGQSRYLGFTLTHFSYETDPDANSFACSQTGGDFIESLAPSGQACCGDDLGDNGRIVEDPTQNGVRRFLCFEDENGNMGWRNAAQEGHAFQIKTVNNNDFTSNKDEWFMCNEDNLGETLPLALSLERDDWARAAKFVCTKKDETYQYLECCDPSKNDERECESQRPNVPGSTTTALTDGLESELLETNGDKLIFQEGNDPDILMNDWSAYSHLNVVFSLSHNFDVFVDIEDAQIGTVFSDQVTNYVETTPGLNKLMHATIPIEGHNAIDRIVFEFRPRNASLSFIGNRLDVHNMYLTPKTTGLKYCSGTRYLAGSVDSLWVDDLNDATTGAGELDPTGEPAGKSACEGIGFGWTGTRCCGDSGNDYYPDSEAGCWGGNVISNSTTAMTVEFEQGQTSPQIVPVQYPAQPFYWTTLNPQTPLYYAIDSGFGTAPIYTSGREGLNVELEFNFSKNVLGRFRACAQEMLVCHVNGQEEFNTVVNVDPNNPDPAVLAGNCLNSFVNIIEGENKINCTTWDFDTQNNDQNKVNFSVTISPDNFRFGTDLVNSLSSPLLIDVEFEAGETNTLYWDNTLVDLKFESTNTITTGQVQDRIIATTNVVERNTLTPAGIAFVSKEYFCPFITVFTQEHMVK